MARVEKLTGMLIGFVFVDLIAWALLGTISWPSSFSYLGPLILVLFVLVELIVLWKMVAGEKKK